MRFTTISFLTLLGATVARAQDVGLPDDLDIDYPEIPEMQCTDGLQVIISRGTGEDPGAGESGKLGNALAERIPGTNITANPYPASWDNPIYFISVLTGAVTLASTLAQYVEACPNSKIAVIGYSQGAQVSSNIFCGAPYVWGGNPPLPQDAVEKNIVAIALLGDPTHKASDSFSRGSAQGDGIFHRNSSVACEALGDRIVSICDAGDPFCDISTPTDEDIHGEYIINYGDELLEWIVKRYETGEGAFPTATHGGHDNSTAITPAPDSTPTDEPAGASGFNAGLALPAAAALVALSLM